MRIWTDDELYDRGAATLLASWEAYAEGSAGASIARHEGVTAAVFPSDPERGVYNNALLERGLRASDHEAAIDAMETAYAGADVGRFAAWVHESDGAMRAALERRGYELDTATRAMGMSLDRITMPRPDLELGRLEWSEYVQVFELPDGLLAGADHSRYRVVVACLAGAPVATALSFDRDGDCGLYNVGTLEHARRQGFGTAITALHLHRARDRGCRTASLQSTPMAERVYGAAGFRDLGRILEYVPRAASSGVEERGPR